MWKAEAFRFDLKHLSEHIVQDSFSRFFGPKLSPEVELD